MKSIYSTNIQLTVVVRMAIGLPYCPIERIKDGEAMKLLKAEANKITEQSVKTLANKFLKYVEKTWINGNYPPETWNYYLRR